MKTALTALVAAAALAAAISASSAAGLVDEFITAAIVGKATSDVRPTLTAPDPGYIRYSDNAAALPGATCYWTRMPVYDSERNVIGWRGRPVAVCP